MICRVCGEEIEFVPAAYRHKKLGRKLANFTLLDNPHKAVPKEQPDAPDANEEDLGLGPRQPDEDRSQWPSYSPTERADAPDANEAEPEDHVVPDPDLQV